MDHRLIRYYATLRVLCVKEGRHGVILSIHTITKRKVKEGVSVRRFELHAV